MCQCGGFGWKRLFLPIYQLEVRDVYVKEQILRDSIKHHILPTELTSLLDGMTLCQLGSAMWCWIVNQSNSGIDEACLRTDIFQDCSQESVFIYTNLCY